MQEFRENFDLVNQWAMLVLDNHSSRNTLTDMELYDENKLILLYLPAHSSALLQPLDLGPNLRLKRVYSKTFHPETTDDYQDRRNRQMQALRRAVSEAVCPNVVMTGWERTGLFPVDEKVALRSKMVMPYSQSLPPEKKCKRGPRMDQGIIIFARQRVITI